MSNGEKWTVFNLGFEADNIVVAKVFYFNPKFDCDPFLNIWHHNEGPLSDINSLISGDIFFLSNYLLYSRT